MPHRARPLHPPRRHTHLRQEVQGALQLLQRAIVGRGAFLPKASAAPPTQRAGLVVASYNVHRCVGMDKRFDPGRVAALRQAGARVITAAHDLPFAAAVELGSLSAAQFHPEKSGDTGFALLRNWVAGL